MTIELSATLFQYGKIFPVVEGQDLSLQCAGNSIRLGNIKRRIGGLSDMGMIKEFKEFAIKGNVMDMAVGIIIGAAFGTVVKSLVDDVIMPPFGMLLGNVDFSNLFVVLKDGANGLAGYATLADAKADGAVTINYGLFVNSIISFIIVAFALFILIKNMNKLKREQPVPVLAPTTKTCQQCFSTIHIKAVRCPNCTSTLQS